MKWISLPRVRMTFLLSGCLFFLISSCAPDFSQNSNLEGGSKVAVNVIYGSDGRLDLYQVTDDRLRALADSTVALVKTSDLSTSGTSVSLLGNNFGSEMNLCSTEKYREQDTAAFCSGTLVGPDTILTAGHCIETQSTCDDTAFVFGFAVKSVGVLPKSVPANEVYRCKTIIKTHRNNGGADYAVIKLDRVVTGHKPLPVRPTGNVALSDSLVVIGHPVGLPLKVATGGTVRSITQADYFQANLDTYGGNSGSGVFNAATGLIEGVLVRGEQDFESRGGCMVSKICAEGACRGEDVTKISVIRPFLPAGGNVTPPPVNPPLTEENFAVTANLSIPDSNKTGISSNVLVNARPSGRKVFVSVNITHPYTGDLTVKITAPDGKVVTLHERAGGRTLNLVKSYEVTSQLGQVSVTGAYKLMVQDLAAVDKGTLNSWSIKFK